MSVGRRFPSSRAPFHLLDSECLCISLNGISYGSFSTSLSAFLISVFGYLHCTALGASRGERLALSEDLSSPIPTWLALLFGYGVGFQQ